MTSHEKKRLQSQTPKLDFWKTLSDLHQNISVALDDTSQWDRLRELVDERGKLMRLMGELIERGLLKPASTKKIAELKEFQKQMMGRMQRLSNQTHQSMKVAQKYQVSAK